MWGALAEADGAGAMGVDDAERGLAGVGSGGGRGASSAVFRQALAQESAAARTSAKIAAVISGSVQAPGVPFDSGSLLISFRQTGVNARGPGHEPLLHEKPR